MSLNAKAYRARRHGKDQGGFTLVETIVALAILAVLCAAAVGIMMFGTNMMHEQRSRANADMLCSMLSESVEDALEGAESFAPNGDSITIVTAAGTSYRPAGTYTLGTTSGHLVLSKGDQSSTLVPLSSYIDGMTEECTFTQQGSAVKVSITIKSGSNTMATNEFTVQTLAGGQS